MTALLLALVGTAIAAPSAIRALSKSEKKQTAQIARNQANKQINQRAAGLSVASAESANSAGVAAGVSDGAIGTDQLSSAIPAASASANSETITSGAHQIVPLNSEEFDTANMHDNVFDNSRITVPVDGIYAVSAGVEWEANPDGARLLRLQTNGSEAIATANQPPVDAATAQSVTTFVALAAGEYVEMLIFQDSGVPLDLSPPDGASLQVVWQAPG
ncbi:MAG: hypothetical protein F9K43_25985 [Bauldia sp.]|nr:MAG: hypothetical protein F9K43_25985 [Bauldia sp.]